VGFRLDGYFVVPVGVRHGMRIGETTLTSSRRTGIVTKRDSSLTVNEPKFNVDTSVKNDLSTKSVS
jgi:hypothetical protein